VVLVAQDDEDFADTVYKYYGKKGWMLTMFGSITFIYAACNVYYELMSQALYPIIEAVIQYSNGTDEPLSLDFELGKFSLTYA